MYADVEDPNGTIV